MWVYEIYKKQVKRFSVYAFYSHFVYSPNIKRIGNITVLNELFWLNLIELILSYIGTYFIRCYNLLELIKIYFNLLELIFLEISQNKLNIT